MKDNELIAEFMGVGKNYEAQSSNQFNQYHSSWDWLMPVVEKCYDNGADENEVGDITHALLDCDIDHTYRAVVEFIKQRERINPKTDKIDEEQNHVIGGVDFSESINQLNNL